jgi:hypothetical protein
MADTNEDKSGLKAPIESTIQGDVPIGIGDVAVLLEGTTDLIYEAKAQVLNRAVYNTLSILQDRPADIAPDPRHRYGLVSMAALQRHRFRMSFR